MRDYVHDHIIPDITIEREDARTWLEERLATDDCRLHVLFGRRNAISFRVDMEGVFSGDNTPFFGPHTIRWPPENVPPSIKIAEWLPGVCGTIQFANPIVIRCVPVLNHSSGNQRWAMDGAARWCDIVWMARRVRRRVKMRVPLNGVVASVWVVPPPEIKIFFRVVKCGVAAGCPLHTELTSEFAL